ncbi:MAG: ABC transporter substrate-binding protein [Thermodesulfobacteriota bacterium]
MHQFRGMALIAIGLLAVAVLAAVGSLVARKPIETGQEAPLDKALRCALDGTRINPLYEVDAYLDDNKVLRFCSIDSAERWLRANDKDKVRYFTVADEVTGERFDASLAHFVASEVVTVPEVGNRIHAFLSRKDATRHMEQYHGRFVDNPFGGAFVVPKSARLDKLRVAAASAPDALPIELALFRPIFKENRLDVTMVPVSGTSGMEKLLLEDAVDALLCDLPFAVLLTQRVPSSRIVKNVLRANPFRALFAVVASRNSAARDLSDLAGKRVAIPSGLNAEFYLDYFLRAAGEPLDKVTRQEVPDMATAWEMVSGGKVTAAVLRTPYTEMAGKGDMRVLADDRNFPWMSVLVVKDAAHPGTRDITKRFLFSLEQAGLALNLKPDEFRSVLTQKGGIPPAGQGWFPMPIFEGSNAPSPDETVAIIEWLREKRLLGTLPAYEQVVDTGFLPDPDSVGLAFCCR